MTRQLTIPHSASFRDPSGFLFWRDGELFRQINKCYAADYDVLERCGLLEKLYSAGLLVRHSETGLSEKISPQAYKVLKPERLPFVSYPYEWCFGELKDAALLTLKIAKQALDHGLVLKDASAFNVQFNGSRPVFIDLLSFEQYRENEPWIAYRQFCQHFLGPLALMSKVDLRCVQLFRSHIDGIPLELAGALLPWSSYLRFGLLTHIHLHGWFNRQDWKAKQLGRRGKFSKFSFYALLDNLNSLVESLTPPKSKAFWEAYYQGTNYSSAGLQHKEELVDRFVQELKPKLIWDAGANVGRFSRIAARYGSLVVAFDNDPCCVEHSYLDVKREGPQNLLPLVIDFSNPSPGLGWAHRERESLEERGPADLILFLALIHHLSIANNLPFESVAAYLAKLTCNLLIEFVPKADSQVQRLLSSRKDIFSWYEQAHFERAFERYFTIVSTAAVRDSQRTLYLMKRR